MWNNILLEIWDINHSSTVPTVWSELISPGSTSSSCECFGIWAIGWLLLWGMKIQALPQSLPLHARIVLSCTTLSSNLNKVFVYDELWGFIKFQWTLKATSFPLLIPVLPLQSSVLNKSSKPNYLDLSFFGLMFVDHVLCGVRPRRCTPGFYAGASPSPATCCGWLIQLYSVYKTRLATFTPFHVIWSPSQHVFKDTEWLWSDWTSMMSEWRHSHWTILVFFL